MEVKLKETETLRRLGVKPGRTDSNSVFSREEREWWSINDESVFYKRATPQKLCCVMVVGNCSEVKKLKLALNLCLGRKHAFIV